MSIQTKQDILDVIRKTATENGGKPLGVDRFEKETGINPYDWGKYWARFGDAQKEAGFMPNQLQRAYADQFLFEKIISLARKLGGKFPTYREIEVENNRDAEFPTKKVFYRLGTKEQFAAKVMEYCKDKSGYNDIVELCEDPSGIEAYWHKRFEAKRMQGEWFDLNSADVKAFKRWRRIA